MCRTVITRRKFCLMVGASIPVACSPGDSTAQADSSYAQTTGAGKPLFGADGKLLGKFEWRRAPIPAGGFVPGLDISSDGSRMVHWADVFNGYIRNAGEDAWKL